VSALLLRELVSVALALAATTPLIVRATRATKKATLKAATVLVATLRLISLRSFVRDGGGLPVGMSPAVLHSATTLASIGYQAYHANA
jgi:hypothetical protein